MNLRWFFYVQNLDIVILEMIYAFFIWTVLMLLLKGKAKRIVGTCAAIISVVAILYLTLYKRSTEETLLSKRKDRTTAHG